MRSCNLIVLRAAAICVASGLAASTSHAALVVTYHTNYRGAVTTDFTDSTAYDSDFGSYWLESHSQREGATPGGGTWVDTADTWHYSLFQPSLFHAKGLSSVIAPNSTVLSAGAYWGFTFSINEPTTFAVHWWTSPAAGYPGIGIAGPDGWRFEAHVGSLSPTFIYAPAGTYSVSHSRYVPNQYDGNSYEYRFNFFIPTPSTLVPALILGAMTLRRRR